MCELVALPKQLALFLVVSGGVSGVFQDRKDGKD